MSKESWQDRYCSTESALKHMFEREIVVDAEFTNEKGCRIYAHGLVLSLWSPLFADMMMKGNRKIPKIYFTEDPETLKSVLKYMYSPAANNSIAEMGIDELIKVLEFAEKYKINQLLSKCDISMLRRKITPSNVMDIFDFAVRRRQEKILLKCTETIRNEGIVARYLKTDFAPQSMFVLLKMEQVAADTEADILMLVLSWLSHRKNVGYKAEALSFVDMASIDWAGYQNVLKYYPAFFSESEMAKILLGVALRKIGEFPSWYKARTTTTVRRTCTTCKYVEKHVDALGWASLQKSSFTRDFQECSGRKFLYKLQFKFKDDGLVRLRSIQMDFGPSEIHQSNFTVLYRVRKAASKTKYVGTTNPFFLDYRNSNYVMSFWKSLKLKTDDELTLIFDFKRNIKASVVDISKISKHYEFPADVDNDVKVNLLSRSVALHCFGNRGLKFFVSTFCFNTCDNHQVFLERHISEPCELQTLIKRRRSSSETEEPQASLKIMKTEK